MGPALNAGIYQVLRFHQPQIAARAKTNAPWEDQTGNARNGLNARVDIILPYVFALTLFGSVKYQIWLEVRFAGKYAIIMRSEEHTSELQSRLHLVCRLLLEKQKLALKQRPFFHQSLTPH